MRRITRIITFTLLVLLMSGKTFSTKAQQNLNVKTLFRLLPADAFSLLSTDDIDELEQYIKVCDIKRGYLSLESEHGIRWEMCYWNLKNGDKLIGVRRPLSYAFYLYSSGKIAPTIDFGIDELNINVSESYAHNCCDNMVDFYVPRYGTTIYLTVNGLDAHIYKWQNEKFVRLSEYPSQNSTHQQMVKGFVAALNTADADRCLQYIKPNYVSEQCMGLFEGNKEQFLCDLISGEDEKGFIKPTKLNEIKKATYRNTSDEGFANHAIFIELKNGRSYTYFPRLEMVETYEVLPGGESGKLLRAIPYIIGGMG